MSQPFEVIWEVDPPVRPQLDRLHDQLDVAHDVASSVLVPDNHTGRATVSSTTVAQAVQQRGDHAIACLNARDRNLLGLRRDLLTCQFLGVDDLLLVYGDEPRVGERAAGLTVRTMVDECRAQPGPLRVGVTTRLTSVPAWKREADRLFVQVSHSIDRLLRWRDEVDFDGPIYPAVMVVYDAALARRLGRQIPELAVPEPWLAAVEDDPRRGVELAGELVEAIDGSGAFAGVHVISGRRHREMAARLAHLGPRTAASDRPALGAHRSSPVGSGAARSGAAGTARPAWPPPRR